MQNIDGKNVYTELAEVVDPQHSALVVVDLQGDYERENGAEQVLTALPPVLTAARQAGVLIIYTRNAQLPGHRSQSPPQLRHMLKTGYDPDSKQAYYLDASFAKILPAVAPLAGERVLDKYRASAFVGTELEVILRCNGIQTVVLVGKASDQCVMGTLWDAMGRDYYAVVVEDCISSNRLDGHAAALVQMKEIADLIKSSELIDIWTG